MFVAALPDPLTHPMTIEFDGCGQQHIGRVQRGAEAAGLPADRAAGLAVAVSEVSTTSFSSSGPVRIRLWTEPDAVICDVAGGATFDNPMVGRSTAVAPDRRERGIRLANALCDLVQVRSRPEGSTVRLHHWLAGSAGLENLNNCRGSASLRPPDSVGRTGFASGTLARPANATTSGGSAQGRAEDHAQ